MEVIREEKLGHAQLLFDPNNYRFHELTDFVLAAKDRFHEDTVQQRAYLRLKGDEGLISLKNSIVRNGYLSVEKIIVRPYETEPDKYLVIEGNRRLAAIRWIIEDYNAGVSISPSLIESFNSLPVLVVDGEGEEIELFQIALMGIRHVSGIKQWGGYQRAKLIAELRGKYHLDAGEVAERLGMSTQEVNRRYRAYKALDQMREDEEYGAYAGPELYPVFHEAVSLPAVRDWLGWSEEDTRFTNEEELIQFYSLIAPTTSEEGIRREPKITTYSQVRELRYILPKSEAKRLLIDPERSFLDALTVAKREELSRTWVSYVSAAKNSLENISLRELENLSDEDRSLLADLRDLIDKLLQKYQKLQG